MKRSRVLCFAWVVACVLLGLASRHFRSHLPSIISAYAGDALWAAMVYFLAATIWNRVSSRTLLIGALLFSFGIELSQLYHAPWIDALRSQRVGALVLGHGFLWSDLLCYTAGVLLAAFIDRAMCSCLTQKESPHV